jgi:hypothetical protein
MATPKQEKLIRLVRENMGKVGNTKTLGELMLEAGYAQSTADNPYEIFESPAVQGGLEDLLKMLDDKRRMAINKITEDKLDKTSPRDLAYIGDVLTKNHQLLSGGATANIVLPIANIFNVPDSNKHTEDSSTQETN